MICVSYYQFIHHFDAKWSLYHNTYLIIEICGQYGTGIKRWTTGWRILFRLLEYIIYQALFTVSNYLLKSVLHPQKRWISFIINSIWNFKAEQRFKQYRMHNHPYVILGKSEKNNSNMVERKKKFLTNKECAYWAFFSAKEYKYGGLKSCFCSNHEVMLLIEYKLEPTGISE